MTDCLTRTLRRFGDPALVARSRRALTSQDMDALHQGAMFMTEQGAGSDVGATASSRSRARTAPGPDRRQVVLLQSRRRPRHGAGAAAAARAGIKGVCLFLLPRRLPDGALNATGSCG